MKQFVLNCLYNRVPADLNANSVEDSEAHSPYTPYSPARDYDQIRDPIYATQRVSPRTEVT